MNLKDIISVTLVLFSVIDIIGSVPIIIDLKNKDYTIEPGKATIYGLILMVCFLYLGEAILKLFGVDVQSFAIAGAIIIFFIGIEMILGITLFRDEPESKSGTLVPLTFPLIAGAGSMTTIISLSAKYDNIVILIAIVLNMILVYFVVRGSDWIKKKVGPGGIGVLRKVFGIILLAISIKMFKENIHLFTPQ